jgi:hypothetical protein
MIWFILAESLTPPQPSCVGRPWAARSQWNVPFIVRATLAELSMPSLRTLALSNICRHRPRNLGRVHEHLSLDT